MFREPTVNQAQGAYHMTEVQWSGGCHSDGKTVLRREALLLKFIKLAYQGVDGSAGSCSAPKIFNSILRLRCIQNISSWQFKCERGEELDFLPVCTVFAQLNF